MLRAVIPAVFLLIALAAVGRQPASHVVVVASTSAAVGDEVIVRLSDRTFALSDRALGERLGGRVLGRQSDTRTVRLGLPAGESYSEASARLSRVAGVRLVEQNLRVRAALAPNDAYFPTQVVYLGLIEAPLAWDIELGQDSVIVAVLDTGVDATHEDLQGRVWTNAVETPEDGVDNDGNGCIDDVSGCSFVSPTSIDATCTLPAPGSALDDNGHGTFVSGIIAASGNNGLGVVGAAPGVRLLPVKILDCHGGGTAFDAAQGVLYAARAGARVANVSFSADGYSSTLANAIHIARESFGMVVVASTGNGGEGKVSFPATLPDVIAVGSSGTVSDAQARSPFSNWGPEVMVVAPGLNILSTLPESFCGGWLCVEGQPYALASGTSFASPFVSALAAMIISRTPNLPPQVVESIISRTAEPLPDGDTPAWAGAGRIRMRAALGVPRFYLGAPATVRE